MNDSFSALSWSYDLSCVPISFDVVLATSQAVLFSHKKQTCLLSRRGFFFGMFTCLCTIWFDVKHCTSCPEQHEPCAPWGVWLYSLSGESKVYFLVYVHQICMNNFFKMLFLYRHHFIIIILLSSLWYRFIIIHYYLFYLNVWSYLSWFSRLFQR